MMMKADDMSMCCHVEHMEILFTLKVFARRLLRGSQIVFLFRFVRNV